MFQLVYASQPTRHFEADDCTHILMQSRRNNPKLGVTGALIFTGWHFVQALEGREEMFASFIRKSCKTSVMKRSRY